MEVNSGNDIVTLLACDLQKVIIEARDLQKSVTLSQLYRNVPMETLEIPLNKITYSTLQKVALWLHHSCDRDVKSALMIKDGEKTPELPAWDKDFLHALNNTELLALVQAAEYLQIDELLEMGCRVIAKKLREAKSVQAIREQWEVNPGWAPEEEGQVKRDLRWCFYD